MENFKKIKVFESATDLSNDVQTMIKSHFQSFEDVDILLDVSANLIKLEYYPQLYSEAFLEAELKQLGVSLSENRNKKGFIKRMLNKLAKDNKEAFGDAAPDCCKLHKN